ncbi:glycoside hydrolase [Actinorhabdospora filicis]|nr:glycoside hydrolase [Actinorhabdospora filicis]
MDRRQLLRTALAVTAGAAGAAALPSTASAATSTIDPSRDFGAWQGWGTSLCWWANTFGDNDTVADLFFSRKTVPYGGTNLPGLGLNIVRYNAGGSNWDPAGGETMKVSPNIPRFKQIQGYWRDWNSADPASASWNWYADAPQRNMMWKARDRGADTFELFSNSPMWWMLYNHNPSGPDVKATENLQNWNYRQHAVYLATIARYAHDHWGVDFTSVEPFNEPSGDWWTSQGTQEGCYAAPGVQRQVIDHLRAELNARDLWWMNVAAPDDVTFDAATWTWGQYPSATRGNVGRINVHGYQYGNGRRDLLYNAAQASGKPIWMSEYGEGDATGMSLASNLNLDFRWLHPRAWVYWQVLDWSGWGLIQCDGSTGWLGPVNTKYHVLAQYTRHIRPGMRIIDSGDGNTVAAHDQNTGKLVVVVTNYGTGQYLDVELGKFGVRPGEGALVRRWATVTGGAERYGYHEDTYIRGSRFWSWFEPNTVQTFEIDGVRK